MDLSKGLDNSTAAHLVEEPPDELNVGSVVAWVAVEHGCRPSSSSCVCSGSTSIDQRVLATVHSWMLTSWQRKRPHRTLAQASM
jgi:hypothetical protein